ncbi:MAG: MBL fold metallo-hydrolase, partial [Gemmatimonadetes bacterium]|nr:MBL fold metallo-hydrolase [Gemmatimonadota bacterium]
MATLHFHGQSTFTIVTNDGTRVVIDPFFDDNPVSDVKLAELEDPHFILCTHGHTDHFADAVPLARRSGCQLIA